MLDLSRLAKALAAERQLGGRGLEPLAVKGLAHDHVRLKGTGLLLRIPKQSQFGFRAADNLAYQAACFERVAASGHGPKLSAVLPPSDLLPMGALAVEEIEGRPPVLPDDLPAIAAAMAKVHALPLPAAGARAPLEDHRDPLAGALAEIESQAVYLGEAGLDPESLEQLNAELAWARAEARRGPGDQAITLVLTDTHPGNFLIRPDGQAVIVDLEKALYGSPGIDLAHATVYSSTTWDTDVHAVLSAEEVAGFYRAYLAAAGPDLAGRLRPWLLPMRRILLLRALTWCAKWSVLHRRSALNQKHEAETTEDWSAENTDPALIAHVAGRVADFLSPACLRRMRGEWLDSPSLESLIGPARGG
jgi:aminoglycoside phosphotransferase (APT) family kinase protein